jgi:hypothetical protein
VTDKEIKRVEYTRIPPEYFQEPSPVAGLSALPLSLARNVRRIRAPRYGAAAVQAT